MKTKNYIIVLATAIFTHPAFATLGENVSSITSDMQQMNMKTSATISNRTLKELPNITRYTFTNAKGTNITEFVTNGTVFAISWSSPVFPNLHQLYGKYFATYSQQKILQQSLRFRSINNDQFFAYSGGVPGKFSGKIVLKQLLPSNISILDIK